MKYASFFERFAAVLVDSVLLIAVNLVIKNEMAFFLVSTAYFVWMNGAYGATVGKMVMGIRIVKENKAKINYSDAMLREIVSYLSFIVLFIGYLVVIWDPKKQAWHDRLAKTVVIK